jgi:hypothetical protein
MPLPESDYARTLEAAEENLRTLVDRILAAAIGKVPVFFLAFMEPPCSYQGTLLNNRRKSL